MTKAVKDCRVIVGMSGGVDSSVAALLLQQQGYQVEGLFMRNWEQEEDDSCPAQQDLLDAQNVAVKLGIKFHTISFAEEYWQRVFQYFLDEYQCGRTPNPDILCNSEIKFRAFLDHALNLGADYIATGHYARRCAEPHAMLRGVDNNKDQSYFLYRLNQYQLKHSLFPVGELEKSEVRHIAEQAGFLNARKKDSVGICFIEPGRFRSFLQQYLPAQPGHIEATDGTRVGEHQGIMYYTLGQRQGLNIGGLKGYAEAPWYVAQKDLQRNVLVVSQNPEDPLLMSQQLRASQCHWIAGAPPEQSFNCSAKIRYRQADQACQVTLQDDGSCQIHFEIPQRAATPGQSVVFYHEQTCLGGAVLEASA